MHTEDFFFVIGRRTKSFSFKKAGSFKANAFKLELKIFLSAMARLYVGNLDPRVSERELEDEFRAFGVLRR